VSVLARPLPLTILLAALAFVPVYYPSVSAQSLDEWHGTSDLLSTANLILTVSSLPKTADLSIVVRNSTVTLVNNTSSNSAQYGMASFNVSPGNYTLETFTTMDLNETSRAFFDRWGDLSDPDSFQLSRPIEIVENRNITLLVRLQHRISIVFTDAEDRGIDTGFVGYAFLQASDGQAYEVVSYENLWFHANKFQRILDPVIKWKVINVTYSVNSVEVLGQNVVQRGLHVFVPAPGAVWSVRLQLYPLKVRVTDLFFGIPIDDEIRISTLETGDLVKTLKATGGTVLFENFPRGDYVIRSAGYGLSLPIPIVLTKPMTVDVKVFSLLDGVFVVGIVAILVGLYIINRRVGLSVLVRQRFFRTTPKS